jgi:DNA-binding transcriptional LysR family regulator
MRREELADLMSFLAVAEERSFTRAAAKLSTSQSALSHTVRRLEARLGVRLLTRTTRNVAPTEAGERLVQTLRPAFDDIDAKLVALAELRDTPAGKIRITTSAHAARTVVWPAVTKLQSEFPDINVELTSDERLIDIVEERYDAGVRLGEQVAKDMVAVRIGPDIRMMVIGSPSYFADHARPETPHDLMQHNCINVRLPTLGGLYAWEFERDGQRVSVRVEGRLVFTDIELNATAALAGHGLAFVMEDLIAEHLASGRLIQVLGDWTPPFRGYHLYYPSRRQHSSAFALFVEAIRYRP